MRITQLPLREKKKDFLELFLFRTDQLIGKFTTEENNISGLRVNPNMNRNGTWECKLDKSFIFLLHLSNSRSHRPRTWKTFVMLRDVVMHLVRFDGSAFTGKSINKASKFTFLFRFNFCR